MKNFKITDKSSGLRRGLGLVALTVAALLASTGVYALNVPAGTYYFDNTYTQWSEVYMRVGNMGTSSGGDGFVSVVQMEKLAGNPNIYYVTRSKYDNAAAVQFSAEKGHTDKYGGIYDGNNITAKFKSEYLYASDIDGHYLFVVNNANLDYVGVVGTNMPATLSDSYIKVNDTWYNGSGDYQSTDFNNADLGLIDSDFDVEADVHTNTADEVSAAFHYTATYATAAANSFSDANMFFVSGDKAKKAVPSFKVSAPQKGGQYSFGIYFQCGTVYDNNGNANYVATYTVPGFTAEGYDFGSKKVGSVSSYDLKLTDVYGAESVSATLTTTTGGFSFASGSTSLSTTVSITDHAGTLPVYFNPQSSGDKSAKLTLTLSYTAGGEEKSKTAEYTISGYGKAENPVCHIGAEAVVIDGPAATLNGYLQYYGCNDGIRERGFVYTTDGKEPTASSSAWAAANATSDMTTGSKWSHTTSTLTENTTYKYKAYVKTPGTGGQMYLSTETGTFTTGGACAYDLSGDTVYFTIDNSLENSVPCRLKFKTFDEATKVLKATPFSSNSKLNYNVVFNVEPTKTTYSSDSTVAYITGGKATQANAILFRHFNDANNADKMLVIRRTPGSSSQPSIQHPVIRLSRNIVFDNVKIIGSFSAYSGNYDNAIDIDCQPSLDDKKSPQWQKVVCGSFANANITIKNCFIQSMGFTCVHVAGYDGVTFENNEMKASLGSDDIEPWNTNYYGASAKFIQCKNIKFLRNNFTGSHATSIWVQGVSGALVMNNVFWNSNDSYYAPYKNNGCFIRLVTQFTDDGDVKANNNNKLTFAYNTFYLADFDDSASARDDHNFDFFRLGSQYTCGDVTLNANTGLNDKASIKFMYNNCYSYDTHSVVGANLKSTDYKWYVEGGDESNWCASFVKNNFWGKQDNMSTQAQSNFAIPSVDNCSTCKKYFVNVENLMCSTACTDPSSLIIKGSALNLGSVMETDNSGLGDNTYYNDRLHPSNGSDAVRKTNGEWTLGAYQQSTADQALTEILWLGTEDSDWDNRNNWYRMDGKTRVTCVDILASDLKVYIPAPGSSVYDVPDEMTIPFFPKFTGERTKNSAETVNAGQGVDQTSTKFANSIELEYGAALHGVSNLKDDEARRYTEVTNHFEAGRKEWILVGTVVKPFADGSKESTRLIQSGDYFLYFEPHVYMNQAAVNGQSVSWSTPFTDLDQSVNYDKVFSIKIPDQYGPNKKKAIRYYDSGSYMYDDAARSKTYDFTGWFLNDEIYPEYKVNGNTLLCNTYPSNIDIAQAISANNGDIMAYDYDYEKNFTDMPTGEIKSQNGFLFRPSVSNNGYFRITKEMLLNTSTKYKSAVAEKPYFKIMVLNSNGDGGSSAKIIYDQLKDDKYDASVDLANVVLQDASTQPEISVALYGKDLDKVVIPDFSKTIPLKLVCGTAMTVEFSKKEMNDIETAELEDKATNKKYDLLTETPQIALAKGTYEGRFYLNLAEVEDPLPTDVDDVTSGAATIDIYGTGKSVIISSSDNVVLKSAEITDMAGRTTYVDLKNPHYNKVNIKGDQGVYVVKVIGDIMSETTKVIVK